MQKSKWALSFLTIVLSFFYSCNEPNLVEPISEPRFGITGKVMNRNGQVLRDVKFYCLFNYTYIPNSTNKPKVTDYIEGIDSFGFKLYQNFPNPVYNSSFVRYSIPSNLEIELLLIEKNSQKVRYKFNDYKQYGLYQHYLYEIVQNLQLENGRYDIILKTMRNSVVQNQSQKSLFVVSDKGQPNVITDVDGIYFFDYKNALIGDTIIATTNEFFADTLIIFNRINLLIKKENYWPQIINISLYPNVLINRDIVLEEEIQ